MKVEEVIEILGLKYSNKLAKDEKFNQLVKYINDNHIVYSELGENVIESEAFLKFLHKIHSVESAAVILKEFRNVNLVSVEPEEMADFYNIYAPEDGFVYPGSYIANLITDPEYLKYASKEWTKEHILDSSFNRVITIKGRKTIVSDNSLTEENEDEYMPSMYQNIEQLSLAKGRGILKSAIESLN